MALATPPTLLMASDSVRRRLPVALELLPTSRAITVTQAADRLGTTTQNISDRLARGTLPGRRVGAVWAPPATPAY